MSALPDLLRFLRLALLLGLVPLIRSCDDTGMRQTLGFPLPVMDMWNVNYDFQKLDAMMLTINIALFALLAVWLLAKHPALLKRLGHWRLAALLPRAPCSVR